MAKMNILKRRWFFTITKGNGKQKVDMYLYLSKDGYFKISHSLYTHYLMNWWQAHWYWLLFNLPKWIKDNTEMFYYENINGVVNIRRLDDEML
jgi:hypothetical protein